MVAAIALIVFSGVMVAGSLQRTEAAGTPAPALNITALNGTENQTNEISGESGITISDPMTVTVVDVTGTVKKIMQAMFASRLLMKIPQIPLRKSRRAGAL